MSCVAKCVSATANDDSQGRSASEGQPDIDGAIDHYFGEAGAELALRFIDAREAAFRHLADRAESGSPRYAIELDLPGLRCWPLKQFPYLIFYIETDAVVDVWRVLHGKRDVPSTMEEGTSER